MRAMRLNRPSKHISRHILKWLSFVVWIAILLNTLVLLSNNTCPRDFSTGGIRTNIRRAAKAEELLRKRFDSLFGEEIEIMEGRGQLLVFECDWYCQTENKFQRGVVSAFLLSVLSERRFLINMTGICSVFNHYDEVNVGWGSDYSLLEFRPEYVTRLYDHPDLTDDTVHMSNDFYRNVLRDFEIKDWNRIPYDVLVFSRDLDLINDILRHKHSFDKFDRGLRMLEIADLTKVVLAGLFETPKAIKDVVHSQLVEQMEDTDKLVCFNNHESFLFTDIFVTHLFQKYDDGYKFYFSDHHAINDNTFANESWRMIQFDFGSFKERGSCKSEFMTYGKRTGYEFVKSYGFDSVVKTYALTLCDVLITTRCPLGITAAQMRGNSDGLFCCDDDGVIYPCKWQLIAESIRDLTKTLVRFKSWREELKEAIGRHLPNFKPIGEEE